MTTYADVVEAASRIEPHVHRTPVITSAAADAELGLSAFFKCENLQKVGAFKARGASNAIFLLPEATASRGVITHSSGNHGQAVAYAAARRGIPATVVMPDDTPTVKISSVKNYGAEVVLCPQPDRAAVTKTVQEESGAVLVHPFDDPAVIAGQGTATLELIETIPDLDAVIAPIGGGGLLSGAAIVAAERAPRLQVWGSEPSTVDDSFRSLESGVRQPEVQPAITIADGLRTGIGELTFSILKDRAAGIVTVTEEAIVDAALFHLSRMKLVVEPSGAVALAGLRLLASEFQSARVGVIISGGNTDFRWIPSAPFG